MVAGRRFYASPPGQQRVRRATDVLALAASLLGAAGLIAAQPPGPFEHALVRFLASIPDWLAPVWSFLVGVVVLWSLAMIVAPLVSRRPRITLEALAAMALAILMGLVAARLATGDWPGFDTAVGLSEHREFPAVRLALAAAVIAVANAHLAHQARITGRWILALGAASAAIDGSTGVSGTAVAILIGLAAGAAVRLALGTSAGRPTIADVSDALSDFGIDAGQLEPARRQSSGVFLVHGTDAAGERLDVKIYGRDAYDNQLLTKIWRTLWYRDSGATVGLTRAYPAEHEAFLTLLARDAGVPAVEVVMAGITAADDSLLVLRSGGQGIGALDAAALDDELLAAAWSAMGRLAAARIYHGRIDPWTVRVNDRSVLFGDFAGGTLADDRDRSLIDQAQLLVTTATVTGIDRAVASAHTALGGDGLAALLPYLQQAALGKSLRQAAKAAEIDVDALRAGAAEATGVEVPEPVRLRRVSWSVVIQIALMVFAAAAVLSFVSGVDLAELRDAVRDASWGWIIAAAVVAQLPRLTQAVSTQGAIPVDVPYGPVYMLQLATSYLNLALPSSLARMAVNVRFFQMIGVSPAVAITSGAIDSFVGNAVQAILLILLLVFSEATLTLHFSLPATPGIKHLLYLLIAIGAIVLALALLRIGRMARARTHAREAVAAWLPQVRDAIASLRRSRKLAQLLLGSVATEVLFAVALGMFARGMGFPLSLAELLVINMSVSLFASFIPVPGGIGIVEGGLAVGLTAAGLPESSALATALLYRIATFYLPPFWGWFALQWLRRNRYL
jgi:uncharacterized protein (TIRG00374 family)